MPYAYYQIKSNENLIELYFDGIPKNSVRQTLKDNNWWWDPTDQCWRSVYSIVTVRLAQKLGAQRKVVEKTPKALNGLTVNERKEMDLTLWNIEGAVPSVINQTKEYIGDLMVVLQKRDGQRLFVGIVEDNNKQNTNRNIFWINRAISIRIIRNLVFSRTWVRFDDEPCEMVAVVDTPLYRKLVGHSNGFKREETPVDVWVYAVRKPCESHPTEIQLLKVFVPATNGIPAPITVYYCRKCRKYYINSEDYEDFAKRHGLPRMRLQATPDYLSNSRYFDDFPKESVLHLMGYNVSAEDNLPAEERQRILRCAIETKTMTAAQIKAFLQAMVYHAENNKNDMSNAIGKWKSDIAYLDQYRHVPQEAVFGKFVFRG